MLRVNYTLGGRPNDIDRKLILGFLYEYLDGFTDAKSVHDTESIKGYSISAAYPKGRDESWLSINAVVDSVTENKMVNYAVKQKVMNLGTCMLPVKNMTVDVYSGSTTRKDAVRHIRMFDAVFKKGKNIGYNDSPTPDIVMKSIINRSKKLGIDIDDTILEQIEVPRYTFSPRMCYYNGIAFPGVNMDIELKCNNADETILQKFNNIIETASYIGVGSYTTRGHGFIKVD